jgi:hypothetical protein
MTRSEEFQRKLWEIANRPIPKAKPKATVKPAEPVLRVYDGDRASPKPAPAVSVYERMYWNAVAEAFAPEPKSMVRSAYDPFSKERMGGG